MCLIRWSYKGLCFVGHGRGRLEAAGSGRGGGGLSIGGVLGSGCLVFNMWKHLQPVFCC